MIASAIVVFAAACATSVVATTIVARIALRIGLVDRPDGRRKLHATPTPLGGGLAVFLASGATLAGLLLLENPWRAHLVAHASYLVSLWLASAVIVVVGLADDWIGLRGRQKVLGQLAAASALIAGGMVIQRIGILGWELELGLAAVPFTLFWLLGAINAVNLLDGIDGLATMIGLILTLAIGAMAVVTDHLIVSAVALVYAGSLSGFLRFNFPPAKVFLGDAGSMLIGLVIGSLAAQGSLKGPGTVLLVAPVAILLIPILDSTAAILRRTLTGRSIYCGDRGHLHHRLLERFGSHFKVLATVAVFCGFTCAAGLVGVFLKNDLVAMLSCVGLVAIFVVTGMFGRAEAHLLVSRARSLALSFARGPAGSRRVRQASVRLQGSRGWDRVWTDFMRRAESLPLDHIRLDVNLPVAQEGFHGSWKRCQGDDDQDRRWRIELPLAAGGQHVGRVVVSGVRNGQSVGQIMEQMIDVLEPFEDQMASVAAAKLPHEEPALAAATAGVAAVSGDPQGLPAAVPHLPRHPR